MEAWTAEAANAITVATENASALNELWEKIFIDLPLKKLKERPLRQLILHENKLQVQSLPLDRIREIEFDERKSIARGEKADASATYSNGCRQKHVGGWSLM